MMENQNSLEYYLGLRYPVTVVPEKEGGYTVLIPDLPGCISVGETVEEALEMIEDARRLWLETAYKHGDEIPLPSTRYDSTVLVQIPSSLYRHLVKEALAEGISLNQLITALLVQANTLSAVQRTLKQLQRDIQALQQEVFGKGTVKP